MKHSHKRPLLLMGASGLILAMVGVGFSGCTLNRKAERDLSDALRNYEQRRDRDAAAFARPGGEPTARRAKNTPSSQPSNDAQSSSDAQTSENATTPQSLRGYILLALEQNPDIKVAEQAARAKAARVAQVTALPDPLLSMKVMPEPVRTAEGDNYFILGIRQKFPVPEKLNRAGRVALAEMRMSLEEVQEARLRVIADVKRAYYQLYIIDKTDEIDRANQELLRGLIDVAGAQVAVGKRSQGDVLRAQVELSTLESQLIELAQRRKSAAAALNRVLNRAPTTPIAVPGDFALSAVDVELERLFDIAAERSPDLARLKRRIERDREAVKLAKLAYWPDFTLGVEWIQVDPRGAFEPPPNPQTGIRPSTPQLSESGSDNWAIVFGMNIPVWFQKIEGGVREARSRLLASQHQLVSATNRVYYEVEDALARVRAQQELADLFESTIIPQARQAYEVSRAAYISGDGDFLFVIDNWQKWLALTIQYHRALGEMERGVADLEQALGLSLGEVE